MRHLTPRSDFGTVVRNLATGNKVFFHLGDNLFGTVVVLKTTKGRARIVAYSEWSSYAVSDTYDEQAARAADAAATLVDSPSATAAELALRVSYTAANAVPYAAERAWQREELERMLRGGGA